MVPLIDVVLVLLVIFIVTAPLLTNVVKLDLPKATSAADIQKPEKVEFAIDANGALFWKGERISREEAIARFAEEGRKRPQPEVYLRADQNVPYRYVAETLADASKGGLVQGGLRQRTGAGWHAPSPERRVRKIARPHRQLRSRRDRRSGSRRPPGKS